MIIVLDTETTGREPPEVIELAYNVLDPANDWRFDHSNLYRFKPTFGSCYGALATHHILDEELKECEPSMTAKVPTGTEYMIGHNVDYDWQALGSPAGIKRICTLAMCRYLYPEIDSHRLGSMCYYFWKGEAKGMLTIPANGGFGLHSAQFDADLCTAILHKLMDAAELKGCDAETLWKFSEVCRIPKIISFGKHKGMAIKDLPRDYKAWILKQADMDPYLVKAVRESYGPR